MSSFDRDTDRYRNLSRRAAILGGVKLALFGGLAARLYYLQITENERFATLAEENRVNMRLLPPTRGLITDRFGVPLASNEQNFRVVLTAEQVQDLDRTLARLTEMIGLTEPDLARIRRDIGRRRGFVPVTVRDNLDWRTVANLEVNAPELPGVSIDVGKARHYPYARSTAHVVGYVGAVSDRELDGDPVLTLPGFKIGKSGVEREYEQALRGTAGTSQVEVNAVGRVIRDLRRDEGQPGSDLALSLDVSLQEYTYRRLSDERSAAAVIMDIHTGEVYSLVSSPGFDTNLFTTGIGQADWRRLLNDAHKPLTNKAVGGHYPPGSTFKMLVALAALEHGVIGEDHTAFCPGHMDLGNHRFHCWKRGGHGRVEVVQALAQSCDVWFYDVARRVGVDRIADMAKRFGLGVRTGIDLPGEKPGLIPSRDWKQAEYGQPWHQGETLVAGIGQGYVLATPLQLAVMTARLANGGQAVVPSLRLGGLRPAGGWAPIDVKPRWLDLMRQSMAEVMSGRRGTARASQIEDEAMHLAGKTGTSQVKRITLAERAAGIVKQEDRPWRDRHHALFVGYAPIHAPRLAVSVIVEHGGSGSKAAAPVARDLLLAAQRRELGVGRPAAQAPGGVPQPRSAT